MVFRVTLSQHLHPYFKLPFLGVQGTQCRLRMAQKRFPCPQGLSVLYLKSVFDVDHFKSPYCICYTVDSILCFGVLGHETCGLLASQPGIKPAAPALEGEVLTTGL